MPRTRKKKAQPKNNPKNRTLFIGGACVFSVYLAFLYIAGFTGLFAVQYSRADADGTTTASTSLAAAPAPVVLDTAAYDRKIVANANISSSTATSTRLKWPVKAVYPNAGPILPFHRIVAYYGNFYSTHMGVLGEYPTAQMLQMLHAEVAKWNAADPTTPVTPAIDYIAVTAQGSAGADGKYRLRMPDSQIDKALALANQEHGIMILDVQVGLSNVQTEIPLLQKYLSLPNVELALDPEFSMKDGAKPGSEIGTMSSSDINFAANYLATLVQQNHLPPKILVVHRFTRSMVTGTQNIKPLPEVQLVMDMDGWGSPAKKINTYTQFIQMEPVQFTGFKLFYKNDIRSPSTRMLTPAELLKLTPAPLFIQYQ